MRLLPVVCMPGRQGSFMIVTLAALLLAATTAAPSRTLTEVVDRYAQWRGGERFQHMRSIHAKLHVDTGGLQGTEEIAATADGTVRVDTDLGPLKQTQVMTPSMSWESTPSGQIQSMALVDVLSTVREERFLFADILRGGNGAMLTLAAPTVFKGRMWATARVSFGDVDVYDMLIDPVSGELGGLRIVEERQERFEEWGDWRVVDGVRMPFRETTTSATPSDDATVQAVFFEINKALDPRTLLRPTRAPKAIFRGDTQSTGWINFEFYAGNRIFIPGRINGRETLLLLDSGASVSTIDSSYAQTVGLSPRGKLSAGGSGGIGTAGFASGVDVEVGNLTLPNLTVASIDLGPVAKRIGHDIPFVLGDELFNELVVDVDFERHRIAFRKPASVVFPQDAVTVPLHRLIGNRSVPVSIDGQAPIDCEFDLGNGSPLDVYPAYYRTHNLLANRKTSMVFAGAVGGFHAETVASLDRVAFAGSTFKNVPTNFTRDIASAANSNRVLGNIGLPILARFRLFIDYSRDRLVVTPIPGATEIAFNIDRVGLALTRMADSISVDFVSPGSPAEKESFKAHEIISEIDGKTAANWTDGELAALRFTKDGLPITFKMADGSVRVVRTHVFY
jgi:hypothetical protein